MVYQGHLTARSAALFAFLALLASAQAHAAWQVTDFTIVTEEPPFDKTTENNLVDDAVDAIEDFVFGEELTEDQARADDAWRRQLERHFSDAARFYSAQGLKEPVDMVRDPATGRYLVYLFNFTEYEGFDDPSDYQNALGIRYTLNCDGSGFIGINKAKYNFDTQNDARVAAQRQREAGERPADNGTDLFVTAAHELFHAVQFRYDEDHRSMGFCRGGSNPSQVEGMAHAVAVHAAETLKPGFLRRTESEKHLGSYFYVLPFIEADDSTDEYETSSFWRFLIERYGGIPVIEKMLRTPLRTAGKVSPADALRWLDSALQRVDAIDLPLYLVFPEFTADVVGWAKARYRAKGRDEAWWLGELFGHCEEVALKPNAPEKTLALEISSLSATCVRVRVDGLATDQRVAVYVMAHSNTKADLDALHLGVGRMTSEVIGVGPSFDCYLESRERGYHRVPDCLEKPYLGRRDSSDASQAAIEKRIGQQFDTTSSGGGYRYVKTWASHDQRWRADFENIFAISRVDPIPDISKPSVTYEVDVAIDFGDLASSETGETHSPGSDINLPGNTKPVPIDESGINVGVRSTNDLTQMIYLQQGGAGMARQFMRQEVGDGLAVIHFSTRDFDILDEGDLAGADQFTVGPVDGPIPFGSTGRFEIGVAQGYSIGSDSAESMIMAAVPDEPGGTLILHRFDDQLLQGELEVDYCRVGNYDFRRDRCSKVERVELSFTKPFGWAYDLGQSFVSEDSPGMRMHRKLSGDLLFGDSGMEWSDIAKPDWSSDRTADDSPSRNGAGSSGGSGRLCECTCDEYRELEELAEVFEQRSEEELVADFRGRDMQRLMQCSNRCMTAYMQCVE